MRAAAIKASVYIATILQPLYSVFLGITIFSAINQIFEKCGEDNVDIKAIVGYTLCITLALANFVEDGLAINPTEESQKFISQHDNHDTVNLQYHEPDLVSSPIATFIIDYPLKCLSYTTAYSAFFVAATANAVPIALLLKNITAKWILTLPPIFFSIVFSHMLAFNDTKAHHYFIYNRLLSRRHSIVLNTLRNPAYSLELISSIGLGIMLRALLYAYIFPMFFREMFNSKKLGNNMILMLIAGGTTAYSTLFSRFTPTYKRIFNNDLDRLTTHELKNIHNRITYTNLLFQCAIRIVRSAGIVYFVFMQMPTSPSLKWSVLQWSVPTFVGLVLIAHGILMGYHECQNTQILKIKNKTTDTLLTEQTYCIRFFSNTINILSRLAYDATMLTSLLEIQKRLIKNNIPINYAFYQIVILTCLTAIPMGFTNYRYYDEKIVKQIMYYRYKFKREPRKGIVGKFISIFRSIEEYKDEEPSPLLSDASLPTNSSE